MNTTIGIDLAAYSHAIAGISGTELLIRPLANRVMKRSTMAGILKFGMTVAVVGGLVGVLATGERAQAETLTIGAAPSLKAAFQEILPMFEKEQGATVHVVYAPSQTLRRQIEQGAPIDVFLPAAVEEVEKLQKKGLTLNGGLRIYAQTSLVLVMSSASPAMAISFHDALPNGATRIALGDPKTSALGEITARALTKLDPAYKSRSRLLYAQHSEDIINLVYTGKADVGIVYRVDAINSGRVRIIDEAPAGTHTPVQFGEAVVWTCRDASLKVAEGFFDFIMSPRIQKLLLKYGFEPVSSSASRAGIRSIAQEP
jgi:molybdate transport system substrate-binding protein